MAVKVEFTKEDVLFKGTKSEVKFKKGEVKSVSESIFAKGKERGTMKLYIEKKSKGK